MPDNDKIKQIIQNNRLSPYILDLITDKNGNGIDDKYEEVVKVAKPRTYQIAKSRHKTNFWAKLRATLAGETTVGVVLGEAKNIVKHFVPFGYAADSLTDEIANRIKPRYKYNTMEKAKSKSKTIIIFGLLFLAGLLESLGVELGLELSPDAKWVMVGAGIVGVILRLVTDKPVKLGKVLKTLTGKD